MSVQFGRWNFDGRPVDPDYLQRAKALLAPYGPDDSGSYFNGNIGILYHAFHTTKESRRETQPYIAPPGAVITWDGRLDNRADLIRELGGFLTISSTDVSVVAAAYERWGTDSFARLLGDWALSIWNLRDRSLILAKDAIGTRQLYYSLKKYEVSWSSILDPLVLLAGKTFALQEEYIAGWLSFFPATHLTPYVGIHSVPPCSSVLIREGKHAVSKYWDFDPNRAIRYRTDAEYEEHFRAAFAETVRRRLRSDSPILAELSGGMDSSSIVCMADSLIARGATETQRLDTISYYDDSEPNWNERPFFTKVEEKRGRTGCHVDAKSQEVFDLGGGTRRFSATPAVGCLSGATKQVAAYMATQGSRVVLSGIGGDEVLGGVPTPIPELTDLLTRAHFKEFGRKLKVWSLNKRKPWSQLCFDTLRGLLPPSVVGVPRYLRPPSWLHRAFVRRNGSALTGYPSRVKLFGPLPTFQENISTLEVLRRQLGCAALSPTLLHERRYPYLDRDFLEFAYGLPRTQLLRPGQRRSLMRRALIGIVPDEVLNRRRKAFLVRPPIAVTPRQRPDRTGASRQMISVALGIIDAEGLSQILNKANHGLEIPIVPLMRTLALESWLAGARDRREFDLSNSFAVPHESPARITLATSF